MDMEDFYGQTRYVKYSNFNVGNESTKYIAIVSAYSGDVGRILFSLTKMHLKDFWLFFPFTQMRFKAFWILLNVSVLPSSDGVHINLDGYFLWITLMWIIITLIFHKLLNLNFKVVLLVLNLFTWVLINFVRTAFLVRWSCLVEYVVVDFWETAPAPARYNYNK